MSHWLNRSWSAPSLVLVVRADVSSMQVDQGLAGHGWRRAAFIWVAMYAIFLAAAPLEHDDLLSELKTPLHCTACTSSVVGSDPARPAIVGTWTLTDLGRAVVIELTTQGILLPVRSTGRSPPASV